MFTLPAQCDALLTCCRQPEGVAILRCESAAAEVFLPHTIQGLPVVRLGDYAFSSRPPKQLPPDTFTVRLSTGGQEAIAHDAAAIHTVHLPEDLLHLGSYAFYNCSALARLEAGGGLLDIGTDAFMNCFALRQVVLAGEPQNCRCLRGLLQEYSGELELRFLPPEGPECRLFFPSYDEDYEEMAAPHIFHYNIQGTGYLCRQSFDGHVFQFAQYDAALDLLLRTHEFGLAVRVALDRLEFPVQLSENARAAYRDCLTRHGALALDYLLETRQTDRLAFFLGLELLDRDALAAGCDLARQRRQTEALSLLLEHQNRRFGAPKARSFDL